jgi:hypothetical protein
MDRFGQSALDYASSAAQSAASSAAMQSAWEAAGSFARDGYTRAMASAPRWRDYVTMARGAFGRDAAPRTVQPKRPREEPLGPQYRVEHSNTIVDDNGTAGQCSNNIDARSRPAQQLVDGMVVTVNDYDNCTLSPSLYVNSDDQNVAEILGHNAQITRLVVGPGRTTRICAGPTDAIVRTRITRVDFADDVVHIVDHCLEGLAALSQVKLPPQATHTGASAFRNCVALRSVAFPATLEAIGDHAFSNAGLQELDLHRTSVTALGNRVFEKCGRLASVKFPVGLASIGTMCFEGCASLAKLLLPNATLSVANGAFYGCSALTAVRMQPDRNKWITPFGLRDVFHGSLKNVSFMSGGPPLVQDSNTYRRLVANTVQLDARTKFVAFLNAVWKDYEYTPRLQPRGLHDAGAELIHLQRSGLFDPKLFLTDLRALPAGYVPDPPVVPANVIAPGLGVGGQVHQRGLTARAAEARLARGPAPSVAGPGRLDPRNDPSL